MVVLGLGSNKGDRLAHLTAAVRRLSPLLAGMEQSALYESKALLPENAPAGWDMPFLNMAVAGTCGLAPEALLAEVKTIESELGRIPSGHWGPREIDIDILAMDQLVLDAAALSIPHRELLNRDFALLPLAEVAPAWQYPRQEYYQGWRAAAIAADKGYGLHDSFKRTELVIHA